jgi:hypothetical protein
LGILFNLSLQDDVTKRIVIVKKKRMFLIILYIN